MAGWLQPPTEAVHVAVRQRARRRPQDAEEPQRRAGASSSSCSTRPSSGPTRRSREKNPEPVRRGAGRGRRHGRHRRGEVRRPVDRPDQGLRLRLGPDAGVRRQHRARTCSTPTPGSAASSAGPELDAAPAARSPIVSGAAGARPRPAPAAFDSAVWDTIEQLQPAPAVHLPVRPGPGLHRRSTRHCPVLKADRRGRPASSRLALCDSRRGCSPQGLDLLGIDAPERMCSGRPWPPSVRAAARHGRGRRRRLAGDRRMLA